MKPVVYGCVGVLMLLLACEKNSDNGTSSVTTIYTIAAGQHSADINPLVFTTANHLDFTALFDSSCIYTTSNPENQLDINKLYGFSDCNTQHLVNSARIGWRWSDNKLRIFAFVHNDGQILSSEITTADIGSNIRCNITCEEAAYHFTVNGITTTLPRNCSANYRKYKLYPYFGGDETAPHTIKISITE